MNRLLLLAMGLVATGFFSVTRADDEDAKPTFPEVRKEFMDKFRKVVERDELFKEYGPKFLELAEAKGEDGFGSLMLSLQIAGVSNNAEMKKQSLELLKKHHLDSKELPSAMSTLASILGSDAIGFWEELMEKGPNQELQAAACAALLEAKEQELLDAKGEEAEKLKTEFAALRKVGVEKYEIKDLFVGAALPDLKSEDLEGNEVKLSDYRDKVVVLDIWATWCPPCRAMIPHERKLVERLKDDPFVLISVSFDNKKETLTEFLEKEEMPWVHWFNGRGGELSDQLNIRFFPTIFVLDGKGVIRFKGVRGEAMDKAVDTLLAEMKAEKTSSQ